MAVGQEQARWDTNYEWKVVLLLGIGFGLVGLDRWIIAYLWDTGIAPELGLNAGHLGNLIGALGLLWGVFAIFSGRLSDGIGHRKILIPAIFIFSLMSGFSGMVAGFTGLILVRALMGVSEGSYTATMIPSTGYASKPSRRGFNQGLQQCGFPLFGLALGPIIATQLLQVTTWRTIFWIVAIPGFIIGLLLYFVLREPADTQGAKLLGATEEAGSWIEVYKSKNVVLGMISLAFMMACVFPLSAFVPGYLLNYLELTPVQMGFVMSGIGFGGFVGQFGIPGLSDLFGRKLIAVISFIGATISCFGFFQVSVNLPLLFTMLFFTSFFTLGTIALVTGPICTESAPPGLVASSIGLVVGWGEIFGGGVAPVITGYVAENFGIQNIVWVAGLGVGAGIIVSLFLDETSPKKLAEKAS